MFVVGKLLTILLLPTGLIAECLLLGLLLSRWRIGRALLLLGAAAMSACLLLPLEVWAIRPLEDRFPAVTVMPERVDGVILLGGAIDDITSRDRATPALTSAANRITTFFILARRYPDAKLVFTGGSGALEQGVSNEAEYTRILLDQLGLPDGRVLYESASRTTLENAQNTSALVHPKPGERWVLLTSASHMPRAVGVFRHAGWTVLPWPVGYQSRDHLHSTPQSMGARLAMLDWAAHEWIGLVAYRLGGASDAWFPGPR